MARADEFIAMLDDPEAPAPRGDHPSDQPLLQILVHLACSDGVVQEEELDFLCEILPGRGAGDVLNLVSEIAADTLDLQQIAEALGSRHEREAAVRFAARLAWADELLHPREEALLTSLCAAFELSETHLKNALDRVLKVPTGEVDPTTVALVTEEVGQPFFEASVEDSELFRELIDVAPPEARAIARVLIDGEERLALYDLGLAADFTEGKAFVAWDEVAYYTSVPLFGAAVRVITVDQRTLSITDRRLARVSSVLDRIFGATA